MVRVYSELLLEQRPESTVALEGLAAWASAAGEHALTAKFCTLLVSAVPAHFEGWFNLGLAHQKSSRWEQAVEAYDEAVKVRPQSCEAYTNLGIVREQIGDTTGARAAYDRAIQANPDALAPIWNIALLLEHSGQLDEAERWYKLVLDKAPKEDEARFRMGYLRLQRDRLSRSHGSLRRLPEVPPALARSAGQSGPSLCRTGRSRSCRAPVREDDRCRSEVRGRPARPCRPRPACLRFRDRARVPRPPDRTRRAVSGSPI